MVRLLDIGGVVVPAQIAGCDITRSSRHGAEQFPGANSSSFSNTTAKPPVAPFFHPTNACKSLPLHLVSSRLLKAHWRQEKCVSLYLC